MPGARPGELIATGPGSRSWVAYFIDGIPVAAAYIEGRLLHRDLAGWWVAGPRGERCPLANTDVVPLVGTVPDGWPVHPEQTPLLGVAELEVTT